MNEKKLSEKIKQVKTTKVKVKTAKNRTIASTKWLNRQLNDPYYNLAKKEGYRSRASYKIIEIQEKFNIFKPGQTILDLGAAPGGWSQVATKYVSNKNFRGKVIAIDKLPIDPLGEVITLEKDFFDPDIESIIQNLTGKDKIDVVISDMAPSTSGDTQLDHLRILSLCEVAFEFAEKNLILNGSFVSKIFAGGMEAELLNRIKKKFAIVKHFKPKSSHKDSKEIFLVAKYFKGNKAE